MHKKFLPILILILILIYLTVSGCTAFVGGVFYNYGEMNRIYNSRFDQTVKACQDTLAFFDMAVTENNTTGIITEIHANWQDGTPIILKIKMKTEKITGVSIRSGYIGFKDKSASELIHISLAERLDGEFP